MPDTAGAAHDQQHLAFDVAVGEHGAVGRHRRDAEAGADVKAYVFRQARHAIAADSDVFGGRTEAALVLRLVHPDAFTLAALVDAVADGLDDAGAVAVRNNEAGIQQVGENADPLLHV